MDANHTEASICFPNTLPRFCGQAFLERDGHGGTALQRGGEIAHDLAHRGRHRRHRQWRSEGAVHHLHRAQDMVADQLASFARQLDATGAAGSGA